MINVERLSRSSGPLRLASTLRSLLGALVLTMGAAATVTPAQLPAQAAAQFVRGTVIDSATRQPIAGSIVMATGAGGNVLARTLANERGVYQVSYPAAATGIRVLHMGFRPRDVPVTRSSNGITQVNVSLLRFETMLAAMNVRANAACSARKDRAAASALYEQVRDGLTAAVVAREASNTKVKRLIFDRLMNRNRNGIASQEVYIDTIVKTSTTFAAVRTAQQFVERGFLGDANGSVVFYAPDAETIADSAFRNAYCFQLGDGDKKRPTLVALDFEKARRVDKQVDIAGSIWVDTLKRTLNSIEFRYVGLNNTEEAYKLGGTVQFREATNGAVMVDEWTLKLLNAKSETMYGRQGIQTTVQAIDVHETGGALVSSVWPDGSTYRAKLGTLRVEATTRDGKPAAGTRISLTGSNYATTLDATGEGELAELSPGPYKLVVLDSTLATIGVTLPTTLSFNAVRDSIHHAKIVAPTKLDYAEERCKSEPSGGAIKRLGEHGGVERITRTLGEAVSFFVYVIGPDNVPLANVEITEEVKRDRIPAFYKSNDVVRGKTDAGGRYFSCWNYKLDEKVQIWIRQSGKPPQLTIHHLTQPVEAVRIVASVGTVASNTNASKVSVRGIAFDSLNNRPLANATVRVSGLDVTATTDAKGAFQLDGIESGFYTISAAHPELDSLGLGDIAQDLDISSVKSEASLNIPSFATLWAGGCSSRRAPSDSGFMYGNIRDANNREELSDARVQVSWTEVALGANKKLTQTKRSIETKSDAVGQYVACGIPVDVALDVTATVDGTTTTLALGARTSRMIRQDVSLDLPASRAAAAGRAGTIKGRVTNAAGDGVSNVRVSVNGIVGARSDSAGAFTIQRVQTGTRTVEFVSVGMTPITRIVDVVEDQTVDVSIKLERVTVLDKVQVTATAKQQVITEFEDRKRLGFGHIQDSTQISRAPGLGAAVRMFPGVLLGRMLEPPIMFRRSVGPGEVCEANYFVDRHRVEIEAFYAVPVRDVAWIEMYPRRFTVPREFSGGRECGVVALFTKFSVGK